MGSLWLAQSGSRPGRETEMNSQQKSPKTQQQAEQAGQRMLRTMTWLAVAVLATMVVGFCVLALYLMSA
jgi:cell division protein FtsL